MRRLHENPVPSTFAPLTVRERPYVQLLSTQLSPPVAQLLGRVELGVDNTASIIRHSMTSKLEDARGDRSRTFALLDALALLHLARALNRG